MDKEKLLTISRKYYQRKDIQRIMLAESLHRETVPRYYNIFGKRPDTMQYENDFASLAEKGATSFHISEEIWKEPLQLSTGLKQQELNSLRIGWDLILDIDCKFLDYSLITAECLVNALKFHNIQNFSVKYSGNKGFHIGLGFDAFPEEVRKIKTKDFFPEGPRLIADYLKELIEKKLSEGILSLNTINEIGKRINKPVSKLMLNGKFNPFSIVDIDTVLISSRHLYRAAYSLHEKTGLASVVIKPSLLKQFKITSAKPENVEPHQFIKKANPNEARELFIQALDHGVKSAFPTKHIKEIKFKSSIQDIAINQDMIMKTIPPCIKKLLQGVKHDGRKRGLFVLITYFRVLKQDKNLKIILNEWNKKNYKPLPQAYIDSQLSWFEKQKRRILPPNCDNKSYYEDVGICSQDCKVKNPVNYTLRMLRSLKYNRRKTKGRKRK